MSGRYFISLRHKDKKNAQTSLLAWGLHVILSVYVDF